VVLASTIDVTGHHRPRRQTIQYAAPFEINPSTHPEY
jgi:hypothetical protein